MARSTATNDVGELYSPAVGMVFVFNLIVGTGALAMPGAFQQAGWLLSLTLVTCIAFTSYVTVTYMLETMACANAMLQYKRRVLAGSDESINSFDSPRHTADSGVTESTSLLRGPIADDYFSIRERVEMGQMVSLFFNQIGVFVFYICIIVYLYGDLAIYAAAVPKSFRDVVCIYKPNITDCNCSTTTAVINDTTQCWPGVPSLDRMSVYRICVILFSLLLGPFIFFNVQKTTVLQVITTLFRWLAFASMIVLAIIQLTKKNSRTSQRSETPLAEWGKVPNLFGVCVYSFMCHHSLPSLVTPIRKKSGLNALLAGDYLLILGFYTLLSMTGIFAFGSHIPDLYTLTFEPSVCPACVNPAPPFFQYFLALFPVFTLSTNFPIIGITLRNNLKSLFISLLQRDGKTYPFIVDRIVFPFAVLIPPVAVAIGTNDLEFLVGITGSYSGAALQYFVPVALLYCGRKTIAKTMGARAHHNLVSPFGHNVWLICITIWALACTIFVTVKHITTGQ